MHLNATDDLTLGQFVEVYMQKKDAPRPLKLIAEASAGKNTRK
jgi:hypothetical protein